MTNNVNNADILRKCTEVIVTTYFFVKCYIALRHHRCTPRIHHIRFSLYLQEHAYPWLGTVGLPHVYLPWVFLILPVEKISQCYLLDIFCSRSRLKYHSQHCFSNEVNVFAERKVNKRTFLHRFYALLHTGAKATFAHAILQCRAYKKIFVIMQWMINKLGVKLLMVRC